MLLRICLICLGIGLAYGLGVGNAFAQGTEKKTEEPLQPDTTKKATSSDRILKELEEYSHRKGLPARAVRELFNFNRKKDSDLISDPELINYEFSQHDYKIVRSIEIVTLDPFGYSINDSTKVPRSIVQRGGNWLHIKTQRGRIRNKLLFKVGKQLEPQALIESERLLRQTEHILDAKIRANEKTSADDSVDIIVTTRDIFSIGGSFAYNAAGTFGVIGLRDVNFLGFGHQIRNKFWFGKDDLPQPWQYQGSYLVENIYRSYFTGELVYSNNYQTDQRGFNIFRNFFATTTKYAGGVSVNWFKYRTFLNDSSQNLYFNTKDFWIARSYKLKSYNLGFDNPGRLITAGRVFNKEHTKTPAENAYLNTTLYLGSIGYSFRKYYKDKYLFGFGRTEDIPAGNLFVITGGYEYSSSRKRPYLGAKTSFGKYNLNFGYLYGGAEFGSFINKGHWQEGAINTEILYFTKLYNLNGWLLRNFIWNRATYGIGRGEFDRININNLEGLRGFRSGSLFGQNRFTLNLESNIFTPLSFIGFQIAGVLFADLAWLSPKDKISPFKEQPYQAYGIGFRFRNEYMAFNTIQVLFAYYPRIPPTDNFSHTRFYENSRRYYEFQDFYYSKPSVIPYE